MSEALAAVRIVLDTMVRLDKTSLMDRAEAEDQAEALSDDALAKRILGNAS